MPFQSQAQSRYFHWLDEHPIAAKQRGVSQAVVGEFIDASHGQVVHRLPEHVDHRREIAKKLRGKT